MLDFDMKLPEGYEWLANEPAPRILVEALHFYGTLETAGSGDNPVILGWARELGYRDYVHDAIPWCGLAMAISAKRAGYEPPENALRALSWATWGVPAPVPMLGDVLTFEREGGGHTGLYVGEDGQAYHIFGGNQSDRFGIARIQRPRLHSARRSPFRVGQPRNVRVVNLSRSGAPLSTNEK